MRIQISLLIAISGLAGCASLPTPFAPRHDHYGSEIYAVQGGYYHAEFRGNTNTSQDRARAFSRLAALEHCFGKNRLAWIISARDLAPGYLTTFRCSDSFRVLQGAPGTEALAVEMVHPLSKDFQGGLLVRDPGSSHTLKKGDVLLAIDQTRITDILEYMSALNSSERTQVEIHLIRDLTIVNVKAGVDDFYDDLRKMNFAEAKSACSLVEDLENTPPICMNKHEKEQLFAKKRSTERAVIEE